MGRVAVFAAGAALLAMACGSPQPESTDAQRGSPTESGVMASTYDEVVAAIEGLDVDEREATLQEIAAAAGNDLTWYVGMDDRLADLLIEGFEDTYNVSVEKYRANRQDIMRRLTEEISAGYEEGADVVEVPGTEGASLSDDGYIVAYDSPHREELVEGSNFPDRTALRYTLLPVVWNSGTVSPDQAPRSYEDVGGERFAGQRSVDPGYAHWYKTLHEHFVEAQGMTADEADAIFEDMATDARAIRAPNLAAELLAQGEYMVSAGLPSHMVDAYVEDGAPLAYDEPSFVEPVVSEAAIVAVVKDAPNPAAAILFNDWILSQGQEVIRDFGLVPALESLQPERLPETVLVDVIDFQEKSREWIERWQEIVRFAEEVEG